LQQRKLSVTGQKDPSGDPSQVRVNDTC
jgi:hypothetical protein